MELARGHEAPGGRGRRLVLFGLLVLVPLLASAQETQERRLADFFSQPRYRTAHWGYLFVDLERGESVLERDADQLFVPASVTKLYSVATALDALGADYRFHTPIHRRGAVDDQGRLQGDLILVASGDLSFGGRTDERGQIQFTANDHTYANGSPETQLTPADPLAGVHELARQVAAAGIRRVQGNVLVDDRLFDKAEGTGSGPSRITPIVINDNLIDVVIEPGPEGQPAKVTWRPETEGVRLEAAVTTVAAKERPAILLRDLGAGRLYVSGRIPAGHVPVVRVFEVHDAASHARTLLIEALQRAGVQVDAPRLAENDGALLPPAGGYGELPVVARLESPPLSESLRLVLKVSHNLQASTLPLLVAVKHGQRTLGDGLRRQHDFLKRAGVDVESISFGGGAGGDRADHVTPRVTVQLLRYMKTRPDFEAYHRALPALGVDGTLAKSIDPASPAVDKVRAKTGTLSWNNVMNGGTLLTSKALAGYMTTARGRPLAFAVFVNNVHLRDGIDSRTIGRDLGKLCEIVYETE